MQALCLRYGKGTDRHRTGVGVGGSAGELLWELPGKAARGPYLARQELERVIPSGDLFSSQRVGDCRDVALESLFWWRKMKQAALEESGLLGSVMR